MSPTSTRTTCSRRGYQPYLCFTVAYAYDDLDRHRVAWRFAGSPRTMAASADGGRAANVGREDQHDGTSPDVEWQARSFRNLAGAGRAPRAGRALRIGR